MCIYRKTHVRKPTRMLTHVCHNIHLYIYIYIYAPINTCNIHLTQTYLHMHLHACILQFLTLFAHAYKWMYTLEHTIITYSITFSSSVFYIPTSQKHSRKKEPWLSSRVHGKCLRRIQDWLPLGWSQKGSLLRGEQWLCLLLSPQPSFPPTCAGSGWGQAHPDLLRGGQEHHQRQGKEAWGAQSPQPWHKACTRVRAHPHPAVGGASWKLCPEPAAGGTLGSQGAAASPLWHISCNVAPGEEQTVAGPSSPECGLLDVELLSLSALLTRSPATFLLALISICLPCSVSSPSLCSSPSLSLLLSPPTPFHLCSPSLCSLCFCLPLSVALPLSGSQCTSTTSLLFVFISSSSTLAKSVKTYL